MYHIPNESASESEGVEMDAIERVSIEVGEQVSRRRFLTRIVRFSAGVGGAIAMFALAPAVEASCGINCVAVLPCGSYNCIDANYFHCTNSCNGSQFFSCGPLTCNNFCYSAAC